MKVRPLVLSIALVACAKHEVVAAPLFEANPRTLPIADDSPAPAEARASSSDNHSIAIIYGASWCAPCGMAELFFVSHGIATRHRDVEKEPDALREVEAKLAAAGKRGVAIPVIDFDGAIYVGFNPNELEDAIRTSHPTR